MSGLFLRRADDTGGVPLPHDPLEDMSFTPWTKGLHKQAGGFDFALTWIEAPGFHPVLHSPELGVSIMLLGRLYDIDKEQRLDQCFEKLVADYRQRGVQSLYPIDGAGALILIDHVAQKCFIITDRMGFFPLYVAYQEDGQRTRVASHPDVLAASYQKSLPLDEVTMAEFLMTGRSAHPYTYYQPIHQLDPASVYVWVQDGLKKRTVYFAPEPSLDYASTIDQQAEELALAFKKATSLRVKCSDGKKAILLSGGLDSRAVLFSGKIAGNLFGITFYTNINREVSLAQKLARLAGVEQLLLQRTFDYYGECAPEAVKISGGMWSFTNAHTAGFTRDITERQIGLLLTGCYCDFLFKGLALDTENKRICRILPATQKLSNFGYQWYGAFYQLKNDELTAKAQRRLEAQYSDLRLGKLSLEDRNRIETCRLFPMSRTITIAFRTLMWRTLPFDLVVADSRLIELFTKIPPTMKLNKKIFKKALRFISPDCVRVADANTGIRPSCNAITKYMLTVGRKFQRTAKLLHKPIAQNQIATSGSWINWPNYIQQSKTLHNLWSNMEHNYGDFFSHLMGTNPFSQTVSYWANRPALFGRILTLGLWLEHRIH